MLNIRSHKYTMTKTRKQKGIHIQLPIQLPICMIFIGKIPSKYHYLSLGDALK